MDIAASDAVAAPSSLLLALAASARPKQWTKNLIVFGPLVFARDLLSTGLLLRALLTFVAFCLVSGSVYVVNDLLDVEKDRQHPDKRLRPIASGQVSAGQAKALALLLGLAGLACSLPAGPFVLAAAAGYLALMFAYSTLLKHLVIIDVFCLAAGFILRAVAGALAIHVVISPWLYLCTLLLALFLGLSKRQNELLVLQESASNHRRSLDEYSPEMLEQMTSIVTASTIMAYALYTFSAESLPENHAMMLTIPFVLYGIFRYQYLVHRRNLGGAPELVLLGDLPLMLDIVLWAATAIGVLYFTP
ncbi:MAG: decaprenyl-phosphate phosphoribosyltransferase [Chloroflexota bacterium]|nr:decaprenyl-phosphate phosphoribosyltransferase [Chloroflexota bacterium]